eukprot:GHVQ01025069.1.p2 GENE.GHVQ01025069.1~~GHVQ01025069.1.p2  ORF type:complete len:371 (+),score=54.83 GHVQ01025069.1:317-1429(+)
MKPQQLFSGFLQPGVAGRIGSSGKEYLKKLWICFTRGTLSDGEMTGNRGSSSSARTVEEVRTHITQGKPTAGAMRVVQQLRDVKNEPYREKIKRSNRFVMQFHNFIYFFVPTTKHFMNVGLYSSAYRQLINGSEQQSKKMLKQKSSSKQQQSDLREIRRLADCCTSMERMYLYAVTTSPSAFTRDELTISNLIEGKTVLDAGCFRGGGARFLAEKLSPRQVVGLDLDYRRIRECLSIHEQMSSPSRLRWVESDMIDLPFDNETFDVVICIESTGGVYDPQLFFEETSRVLRRGGVFILLDRFKDGICQRDIESILKDSGFEVNMFKDIRHMIGARYAEDEFATPKRRKSSEKRIRAIQQKPHYHIFATKV